MGLGVAPKQIPPITKILQRKKDGTYEEVEFSGDLPVPKVVSQATSTSGVPLLNGKPLKIQDKREK